MDLKYESGITLVELLAALSLLMVVILLAGSIHMFGQRQFRSQTESTSQANNISYALTEMSSDIRRFAYTDLSIKKDGQPEPLSEGNEIYLGTGENKVEYLVDGNELQRNGLVITGSIDSMNAKMAGTHGVTIILTSNSEHSNPKIYETTITFRGVDDNETDDK